MDEKKMFDKAKKPITRGYADHKITTLQEGFAATNNLADLCLLYTSPSPRDS